MNAISYGNYLLKFGNFILDASSAPEPPPVPAYKRYMWKFTGAVGRTGASQFQMSCLRINDVSFPYTRIASHLQYGSEWSDGSSNNLLDADETNKWGGGLSYNSGLQTGWIIFDLPSAVVPVSYLLKTANDTAYENRNPTYSYLYASLSTPITDTDSSWVLLDERDPNLPRADLTWCGPYILNQV